MSDVTSISTFTNLRRSLLARTHAALGARYVAALPPHLTDSDTPIIADYGDPELETTAATLAGLCDVSMFPRWGCKGRGTPDWLKSQSWRLPDKVNHAEEQKDGNIVARLSNDECLLMGDLHFQSARIAELEVLYQQQLPERVYALPRADSHACFVLCGEFSANVMSKICAVDLRSHTFSNGHVAQTSVARVNAITVRQDINDTLAFYILSDLSSSEYLWECLLDALLEFNGCPVGIDALHALGNNT